MIINILVCRFRLSTSLLNRLNSGQISCWHIRARHVCVCVCDFACRHCTVWLSFSHFCSTDVNRLNLHRLPTWRNILNMYDSGKRITRTPLHTSYINQNSISLFEPHVRAYDYDHGFFFSFFPKDHEAKHYLNAFLKTQHSPTLLFKTNCFSGKND